MIFKLALFFFSFLGMLSFNLILVLLVVYFVLAKRSFEATGRDLVDEISFVFQRFFLLRKLCALNLLLELLLILEVQWLGRLNLFLSPITRFNLSFPIIGLLLNLIQCFFVST